MGQLGREGQEGQAQEEQVALAGWAVRVNDVGLAALYRSNMPDEIDVETVRRAVATAHPNGCAKCGSTDLITPEQTFYYDVEFEVTCRGCGNTFTLVLKQHPKKRR